MSDTIQLLLTVAINLLVVFLVIRAVRSLKVDDVFFEEAASKKYYNELVVSLEVVELDMAEKLKYGVPVIPVFYLYPYFFGILSGKMNYTRKVFLIHENGEESTKFVTFTVKNKVVVACIEFDSYDI